MKSVSNRIAGSALGAVVIALVCAGIGTSGCSSPSAPEMGTLRVIGACSRAGTIDVFVDGASRGNIGGTGSASYPLPPGAHTISARSVLYTWPSRTITILGDQVLEFRLIC